MHAPPPRLLQYPDALRVALRRGGADMLASVKQVFAAVGEEAAAPAAVNAKAVRRQLGYILARHRVNFIAHDDGALRAQVARGSALLWSRGHVPAGPLARTPPPPLPPSHHSPPHTPPLIRACVHLQRWTR